MPTGSTNPCRPGRLRWRALARRLAALTLAALALQPAQAQSAAAVPPEPLRVEVREFRLSGNSLLGSAELLAGLQPLRGRRSLEELRAAARQVEQRYRAAGYGAVLAYLPEQELDDGVVTIAVREGRIGRVEVIGAEHSTPERIRALLPALVSGAALRPDELDLQLRLANDHPMRQLAVALEPGSEPGSTDARVLVSEQAPLRWSVGLDNGGSHDDRWRQNIGVQLADLWQRDGQLWLQTQLGLAQAASYALSAGAHLPFHGHDLSMDLMLARADTDSSFDSALGALQFNGRGDIATLRLNRLLPRQGELEPRLSLGLTRHAYLNDCRLGGLGSVCGPAGASVTVQPLALEVSLRQGGPRASSLSFGLSRNLNRPDAEIEAVRPGAAPGYRIARLGLQRSQPLAHGMQLRSRLDLQWSPDALIPGEQFSIAGSGAVRGYDERELSGDRGVTAALELLSADLAERAGLPWGSSLRLLGFVDAGALRNRLDTECRAGSSACQLLSTGAGLRLQSGGLQAQLDLAHALRDSARTARAANRLHVLVNFAF